MHISARTRVDVFDIATKLQECYGVHAPDTATGSCRRPMVVTLAACCSSSRACFGVWGAGTLAALWALARLSNLLQVEARALCTLRPPTSKPLLSVKSKALGRTRRARGTLGVASLLAQLAC